MKIVAVCQRGKKRDFFDLYWITTHVQDLMKSIESAQLQYSVKQNPSHILKSLVYFEDAEDDPTPELYFTVTWNKVKEFFKEEVQSIAKKMINL